MLPDLLIHRVEVYRRSGRTDRFGQPVDVNPRQHAEDEVPIHTYPCRLNRGKGGMVMMERSIDTFETTWCMYCEAGVDIREDDAVRVIDPNTGEVLAPMCRVKVKSSASDRFGTHHLEFDLWAQKGAS